MKKKQKSITDGPAAALGAARRGAKLVIEPRGAYNATSKLHDFDGECGAAIQHLLNHKQVYTTTTQHFLFV